MKPIFATLLPLFLVCSYTAFGQRGWKDVSPGNLPAHLLDAKFYSDQGGYAVGWSQFQDGSTISAVVWTRDGGGTWQTKYFYEDELNAIGFASENTAIAVGRKIACNCPVIVSTQDGGATWEEETFSELSGGFNGVDFVSPSVGIVGGGDGEENGGKGFLLRTEDGGENYALIWEGGVQISMVDLVTPSTLFATGGEIPGLNYQVFRSLNADAPAGEVTVGEVLDFGGNSLMNSIDFPDADHGYAVLTTYDTELGFVGEVYKTEDGGENWDRVLVTLDYTVVGIGFNDANHGVSVGSDGSITMTEDGGKTWNDTVTYATNLLVSAEYASPSTIYAIGTFGVVLKYEAESGAGVEDRLAMSGRHVLPVLTRGGGRLVVDRNAEKLGGHLIEITDLQGRVVLRHELSLPGEEIDLNRFAPGYYFYRLFEGGLVVETGKVPVQ